MEGLPGTFLVQETVPMHYEYRVFVVGGRPVTDAGAVEEHTPLDNRETAFSTLVHRNRAAWSEVDDAPALVTEQILSFAQRVIDQLKGEVSGLQNYTLDVALGADGEPLVVELNSGFYASAPRLVTYALLAGAAKMPAGTR